MKKNGYISVILQRDMDCSKKGDEVMTASNEFGTLDDESIITCYTKDGKEIAVSKNDLKIKK